MKQKKAQGFLFIFLFLTCGIIGILLANQVHSARIKTSPTAIVFPSPAFGNTDSSQTNIVLIRVDDLTKDRPKLVSVWIAFLGPVDYPGLTLMALYPDVLNPSQVQALSDSFRLNESQQPVQAFLEQLSAFRFTWDGYILADSVSISPILTWINNTNTDLTASSATETDHQVILTEETEAFKEVCKTLGKTTEVSGPPPNWSAITPAHLKTDLTFEKIMYSWGKLNPPGNAIPCYILDNP